MTAEQLEELLGKLDNGHPLDAGRAMDELFALAPSLARRVIAAEKLVEALEGFQECDCKRHNCATCAWFSDADEAITAYREASK